MNDTRRYEELSPAEQRERLLDDAIEAFHEHAELAEKHAAARKAAQELIVRELPVGSKRNGVQVMPGRRSIDQAKARALLTAEQYEAARKQEVTAEGLRLYVAGVLAEKCYGEPGAPFVRRVD